MFALEENQKLKIELESHGSILFYYLRDYITPDEEEDIYEEEE